jgi:uncharacterized protein YcfJ
MRRITCLAVAATLMASSGYALAETDQQKKQHEAACIAGTAAGAVIGAALGGFFGNGVGKTVMQVAMGGGGAYLAHKHTCKQSS